MEAGKQWKEYSAKHGEKGEIPPHKEVNKAQHGKISADSLPPQQGN